MFAKSLLATTALVVCVSAASAGTMTGRMSGWIMPRLKNLGTPGIVVHGFPVTVITGSPATAPPTHEAWLPKYRHAIFDNINWRDKNAEWLTWYGFGIIAEQSCYEYSSNYHYCFSETGFNALPFHGKDTTAKHIGVALAYTSTVEYNIGIYSATASGLPGDEIAGASATAENGADFQLTWVDVDVKLKRGTEYFLAVSCGPGQTYCDGAWDAEDTNFTTAQDYWHVKEYETEYYYGSQYTYSYSSPWHESIVYDQGAGIVIK